MDEIKGIFDVYDAGVDAQAEFSQRYGYPPVVVIDVDGGTIAGPILAENAVVYEPGEAR